MLYKKKKKKVKRVTANREKNRILSFEAAAEVDSGQTF
jgi:hypothetical protein